jgi:hypothetical protein
VKRGIFFDSVLGMQFWADFIGRNTDKKVAESCRKLQKVAKNCMRIDGVVSTGWTGFCFDWITGFIRFSFTMKNMKEIEIFR